MTSTTPTVPDLYRFHCHGCNRRLRLARAHAGHDLRCSSCGVRFTAPPPAADEAIGLPNSSPARALRRPAPKVASTRSVILNRTDDEFSGGEDEFERSLDAMATFAAQRPELAFPQGYALPHASTNEDINQADIPGLPAAQAPTAARPADPLGLREDARLAVADVRRSLGGTYRLKDLVLCTGLGLMGGLIAGLLLALSLKH